MAAQLPQTSTSTSTIFIGFFAFILAVVLVFFLDLYDLAPRKNINVPEAALFFVFITGIFMGVWIFFRERKRNPMLFLPGQCNRNLNYTRIWLKWFGFIVTICGVSLMYWLFPIYKTSFYSPFFHAINAILLEIIISSWFYFRWMDQHSRQPDDDDFYRLGLLFLPIFKLIVVKRENNSLTGKLECTDFNARYWLPNFIRSWVVKAFFIPLMFGFICQDIGIINNWRFDFFNLPWVKKVEIITFCIFFIDVVWGCVGYVWSLKIIDTHIKSADSTLLGWVVTLAFYAPFNNILGPNYLSYETNFKWDYWIGDAFLLGYLWGGIILVLQLIFLWSTVIFGLRFSNLTYRGIITAGPYRWFKHPAYICKNLTWWLVSMPFMISSTWAESVRLSTILLIANIGYYLRAKTEERHLKSVDPDYRVYSDAMDNRMWVVWMRQRLKKVGFALG